jgi:hypothetical protein
MQDEFSWRRTLAAGSLVAGAVFLLTGRKKAALAVAGIGVAVVLAEDKESLKDLWGHAPEYLQDGQEFLGRLEGVVETLTEQGDRVQHLLQRA